MWRRRSALTGAAPAALPKTLDPGPSDLDLTATFCLFPEPVFLDLDRPFYIDLTALSPDLSRIGTNQSQHAT